MFNAATLKHGLLTVYGSDDPNVISITNTTTPAAANITVTIDGQPFAFRSTGITRMRVFAMAGDDTVTLGDAYMPNLTDVAVFGGDGNDALIDKTVGHRYNRATSVSLMGEAGNDTITGGDHTELGDGGDDNDVLTGGAPGSVLSGDAGNDTISGGAAGSSLEGGDGDDVLSAGPFDLADVLTHAVPINALSISGGAGHDTIVGNYTGSANVDTISGGDFGDTFLTFPTDNVVDFDNSGFPPDEIGNFNDLGATATVTKTATLSLVINGQTVFPAQGIGNVGPNPHLVVSDSVGTITAKNINSADYEIGDFLNVAGYFFTFGIPSNVTLTVNGFPSTLTGNSIDGYVVNPGDNVVLTFN